MGEPLKRERNWMLGRYDLHIPYELRYEWHCGAITAEQVLFLTEIESFVQHSKDFNELGIWPTNRQLAKKQGCTIRRIQQILGELTAKGFIIVTRISNRRYIRTLWSHAVHQRFNDRRKRIRKLAKKSKI